MKLPLSFPERLNQHACAGITLVVYTLLLTHRIGVWAAIIALLCGYLVAYLVLAGVVRYADYRARWYTCHAALTSLRGHLMDGWDCCACRRAERHLDLADRRKATAIPCEVGTCPRCGHACCDPQLLPDLRKLWRPRRGMTHDRFGRGYVFADFFAAATEARAEGSLAEGLDLAEEALKLATNAAELQALLPLALDLESLWCGRHPTGSRSDALSFSIRHRLVGLVRVVSMRRLVEVGDLLDPPPPKDGAT